MDLRQIQYIVAIAEENNITRAAEKLYITQSALNQQLLKLEKELGVQLFHRSRTDWHPTEAGEIYLRLHGKCCCLRRILTTGSMISRRSSRGSSVLALRLGVGSPCFLMCIRNFTACILISRSLHGNSVSRNSRNS